MKKNLSYTDRTVRLMLALIIAFLYFTDKVPGTFGIILLIFAIVFAATSLISFCPLYALFGISTNKKTAK